MPSLAFLPSLPLPRTTSSPLRLSPYPQPANHHNICMQPRASLLPLLPKSITSLLPAAATAATPFAIWATLLSAATLGLTSQTTRIGRALSPPVVATLTTLFLSNLAILPAAHPIYTTVTSIIVPLAVPLLLLGADLRRVIRDTGRLLPVFTVAAIATLLATVLTWRLVALSSLGDAAWKIAAALCARHIGGAVNYVAVTEATSAPPSLVTAALTADNVVVALYFLLLLFLARNVSQPALPKTSTIPNSKSSPPNSNPLAEDAEPSTISVNAAGISLAISASICAIGSFLATLLPIPLGPIPIVTLIVLIVATMFPTQLQPYRHAAASVGIFFMQIFFAVAGAGGSILAVLRKAPVLLLFSTVQLAIHLAILLVLSKLFRFHRAEVLIASNACVGGPTTAAAMAAAKNWDRLVIPAILIGVFGYSIATFLSLGIGYAFLRVM